MLVGKLYGRVAKLAILLVPVEVEPLRLRYFLLDGSFEG